MMRLAVVIVSYNTRNLLRVCLQSVAASAGRTVDRLAVSVWVVDNASHDGSASMVAEEFPQVHLVTLDRNLGFTGANNLALRALGFPVVLSQDPGIEVDPSPDRPDCVLLLNPDTEVVGEALHTLAAFLRDHPAAGACGARLQYPDGGFQHGAFRFPSYFQVALDFFPLTGLPGAHHLYNSRANGRYPLRLWGEDKPFVVDFVLGAALMVRAAAIDAVGGLDDEYWMYCEEMDWCLRLAEASWQVYAVPTAVVVHYEGQSSRQVRWGAFVRLWRSRFRFYARHRTRYGRGYVSVLRLLVKAGSANQRRLVRAAFSRGKLTGVEAADALAAYRAIEQL